MDSDFLDPDLLDSLLQDNFEYSSPSSLLSPNSDLSLFDPTQSLPLDCVQRESLDCVQRGPLDSGADSIQRGPLDSDRKGAWNSGADSTQRDPLASESDYICAPEPALKRYLAPTRPASKRNLVPRAFRLSCELIREWRELPFQVEPVLKSGKNVLALASAPVSIQEDNGDLTPSVTNLGVLLSLHLGWKKVEVCTEADKLEESIRKFAFPIGKVLVTQTYHLEKLPLPDVGLVFIVVCPQTPIDYLGKICSILQQRPGNLTLLRIHSGYLENDKHKQLGELESILKDYNAGVYSFPRSLSSSSLLLPKMAYLPGSINRLYPSPLPGYSGNYDLSPF